MPGHAHEQRAIVAEVGWPPVLGVGHQRAQVLLEGLEVEALESLGVVEVRVHRIGLGRMLVENPQVELVRPPVTVGGAATCGLMERAFRFVRHLRVPLGRLSRFPVYARCSFSRARGLVLPLIRSTRGLRSCHGEAGAVLHAGADTPPARGIRGARGKTSRAWADF
ncbi:hypothetical protein D9M71_496330 [compost metagenome]